MSIRTFLHCKAVPAEVKYAFRRSCYEEFSETRLWREVLIRALMDLFGDVQIEDRDEIILDAREWFQGDQEQVRLVFERANIEYQPIMNVLREVEAI